MDIKNFWREFERNFFQKGSLNIIRLSVTFIKAVPIGCLLVKALLFW